MSCGCGSLFPQCSGRFQLVVEINSLLGRAHNYSRSLDGVLGLWSAFGDRGDSSRVFAERKVLLVGWESCYAVALVALDVVRLGLLHGQVVSFLGL